MIEKERLKELWTDSQAAAHTVGYILMIAIFLGGGLTLFVAGLTVFESGSQSSPVNDAETEMQTLQTSFNSFTEGVPSRQAELSGGDVTMSYGDPVTITVDAKENNGASISNEGPCGNADAWCELGSQQVTPLVYQVEGGQVAYLNGAVILSQGPDSGIVRSGGPWRVADYARFPLLATQQAPGTSSSIGQSGSGSFVVEGYSPQSDTTVWEPDESASGDPQNLDIRITMDNVDNVGAWETYFEKSDSFDSVTADPANNEIVVYATTDRVVIQEIQIDVTYRTQ